MKKILLIILTLSLSSVLTLAQSTTGRIVGSVSAADGVIPGATIVAKDNQTGREQTITASDDGTFVIPQLSFGTYTVTITKDGYKTFTATEVKIDAGREYPLNAVLEVGQVSEQVTITAGAEQINATNGELSTTISTQQVRELPLNGRNPLSLISLQAGANPTTSSINGQRSTSTVVTRDGLNIQDNFIRTGGFVGDRPTVDDVSEVTVVTSNAGVELGGGSSAVQLVTPRGGADFHGNLYEFNRNSKFAANTFANNSTSPVAVPRPFLNRNQFGGSISGPVPVFNFGEGGPMFLKNKGFFFFNYEGYRLSQQVNAALTTLDPIARNGTFTYTGTDGVERTVNVLSGAGFNLGTTANQTLFANAGGALTVDPVIQARLLNLLPTGNGIRTGTNFQQVYNINRANGADRSNYSGRFDLDINDRNSVNAVYKRTFEDNLRADLASGFATTPFVTQGGITHFFVGSYRAVIANNFSTEFRGGLQLADPFFNESQIPSNYVISQGLTTSPEGSQRSQGRDTTYNNVSNNSVYTFGNHSIRFGGQYERYDFTSTNLASTTPTYTITTTGNTNTPGLTANLLTGISAADLARANTLRYTLGGIVGSASTQANLISPTEGYGFGPSIDRYNFNIWSGYVSDQYRFRPNLTLNLGVRYDYYTPLKTPVAKYLEAVLSNPDDVLGSVINNTGGLNIVGTNTGELGTYFKPDRNNFAPSISFAYSPKFESGILSKLTGADTVLRGGAKISYINDEYVKAASTLVAANPGLGAITINDRSVDGTTNIRAALTPRNGFGAVQNFTLPTVRTLPISLATNNAEGGFTRTLFGVDPNYKVQQVYEYNLGIQRKFFLGSVFEIRYVGGFSNTAARSTDYNQVDIQANGFLTDFLRAQNNCRLQGATLANPTNTNPINLCTSAAYNPAIAGSQELPVFNRLSVLSGTNGGLTNATILASIRAGTAGTLARTYIANRLTGSVVFQPTTNAYAIEYLVNGGKYNYNALQTELRRRFNNGFSFQVNYTFQKSLTDILSDANADQNRQGTFLDNNRPGLNYGRADYDRTHTVNGNFVYELPFGKGRQFLNDNGILNTIFGGFQFSSIVALSSGPPLGVVDPRATFNSRGIARQGALSNLSAKEIKKLTGIFNTPNGIYFVNPKVLFATATAPGRPALTGFDLNQPLPAGYTLSTVRATSGVNETPFAGQVFFFNNGGQTGNLPVNFINGAPYLNWDAGLSKNFKFTETTRLQLRMEAFNLLNQTVPSFGADLNIDSNNFGRITSAYSNRIIQFGARFDF